MCLPLLRFQILDIQSIGNHRTVMLFTSPFPLA